MQGNVFISASKNNYALKTAARPGRLRGEPGCSLQAAVRPPASPTNHPPGQAEPSRALPASGRRHRWAPWRRRAWRKALRARGAAIGAGGERGWNQIRFGSQLPLCHRAPPTLSSRPIGACVLGDVTEGRGTAWGGLPSCGRAGLLPRAARQRLHVECCVGTLLLA